MKLKIIAALLAISSHAHAEFLSGNDLLERITSERATLNAVAIGYVMGVIDTGTGVLHCTPPSATAGQLADMVKGYLEKRPEIRHYSADSIINDMLKRTWPCASKQKQGSQVL